MAMILDETLGSEPKFTTGDNIQNNAKTEEAVIPTNKATKNKKLKLTKKEVILNGSNKVKEG